MFVEFVSETSSSGELSVTSGALLDSTPSSSTLQSVSETLVQDVGAMRSSATAESAAKADRSTDNEQSPQKTRTSTTPPFKPLIDRRGKLPVWKVKMEEVKYKDSKVCDWAWVTVATKSFNLIFS